MAIFIPLILIYIGIIFLLIKTLEIALDIILWLINKKIEREFKKRRDNDNKRYFKDDSRSNKTQEPML